MEPSCMCTASRGWVTRRTKTRGETITRTRRNWEVDAARALKSIDMGDRLGEYGVNNDSVGDARIFLGLIGDNDRTNPTD